MKKSTPPKTEEQNTPDDGELHRVYRWRYKSFRKLGFTIVEAQLLADSTADLGIARKLDSLGCSLELAREILL